MNKFGDVLPEDPSKLEAESGDELPEVLHVQTVTIVPTPNESLGPDAIQVRPGEDDYSRWKHTGLILANEHGPVKVEISGELVGTFAVGDSGRCTLIHNMQ
jgi:hypothetical protein